MKQRRALAASALPLLRVVKESLLDHLLAAPGLPCDLFHGPDLAILAGEFEPPTDRRVVAVEQERSKPRGLDAGNGRQHAALLFGQHIAAGDWRAVVFAGHRVRRIEVRDGAD